MLEYTGSDIVGHVIKHHRCVIVLPILRREQKAEILKSFSWDALCSELRENAPTTVAALEGCIMNSDCCKVFKPRSINKNIVTCALLLQARSQRMNLIQISVILRRSHASKQVHVFIHQCRENDHT